MSIPYGTSFDNAFSPSCRLSSSDSLIRRRDLALKTDISPYPRNEVVWQIFGPDVGFVINDFSCAVQSKILLHGRLYITSGFLLFYSNIFSFEKIVKIPFTHVRGVSRESTALFIPNAIAITTSKSTYVFRSFWDREEAYFEIKNAHRASHGLSPLMTHPTEDNPFSDDDSNGYCTNIGNFSNVNISSPVAASEGTWNPPNATEDSEEDDERIRNESETDEWKNEAPNGILQPQSILQPESNSNCLENIPALDSMDLSFKSAIKTLERGAEGSKSTTVNFELKDFASNDETVLQKYYNLFLSDAAPFSLVPFHLSQGDSDVAITKWDGDQNGWQTRELRYLHPYTGAMGSSSTCRTVKAQRFRTFGKSGLILQTTTYLEDVPMSDYFQLEDRCIVQCSGKSDLSVEVVLGIKFIKNTMMKGIIEGRSLSESKEVWQKFFEMVKNSVATKENPTSQPEPTPEQMHDIKEYPKEVKLPKETSTTIPIIQQSRKIHQSMSMVKMGAILFFVALPWVLLLIIACTELIKQRILKAEITGVMNGVEVAFESMKFNDFPNQWNCCCEYPESFKERIISVVLDTYSKHRFLTSSFSQ